MNIELTAREISFLSRTTTATFARVAERNIAQHGINACANDLARRAGVRPVVAKRALQIAQDTAMLAEI